MPWTHLLQNHTRTTSFSMVRLSASSAISSDVGLGFWRNAFSSATLTLVSMDVLFFRRLPIASGVVRGLVKEFGLLRELSASSSHFWRRGFSLHMFLKERFRASNLEIVVCEKSFPYSFPIASPTSPCVNPSLILRCLNVFANCSSSSRSVVSSGDGSKIRDWGVLMWWCGGPEGGNCDWWLCWFTLLWCCVRAEWWWEWWFDVLLWWFWCVLFCCWSCCFWSCCSCWAAWATACCTCNNLHHSFLPQIYKHHHKIEWRMYVCMYVFLALK